MQNPNVLLVCAGTLLIVVGFSGACRDAPPPSPENVAREVAAREAEAAYQRRSEAASLERCLPFTCTVEAVQVADRYVGACTETWREQREVREAQRARGIPVPEPETP